jgi:hypothetical protein
MQRVTARTWYITTSADLDVVVPGSDVGVLAVQLSIMIRHCLVKSTLHGVPFEAFMPQVLLHAVRESYNQRNIFGEGKRLLFSMGVSLGASALAQE